MTSNCPPTRKLGTRRLDFDVTVEYGDQQTLSVNGYANVLRPSRAQATRAWASPALCAQGRPDAVRLQKTLTVKVKPLESSAIDDEVALLDRVSQQFGTRLLGGQDAGTVWATSSRSRRPTWTPRAAALAWADNVTEADGPAFTASWRPTSPTTTHGPDPSDQGRTFASSDSSVVSNGTAVTKPEYNTKVKITANLASEKYQGVLRAPRTTRESPPSSRRKLAMLAGTQM